MGLISYIKTVWQAGKSGNTPFTPERFNNIEDGIVQATNELNDKEIRLTEMEDRTSLLESTMIDVALDLSEHEESITELQGDVAEINSNLDTHINDKSLSGGDRVVTTTELTRAELKFKMNRGVVFLTAKRNKSGDASGFAIYYLVFDNEAYSFVRLAGDVSLNIDYYEYSASAQEMTIRLGGLYSGAELDIISHKLISCKAIA